MKKKICELKANTIQLIHSPSQSVHYHMSGFDKKNHNMTWVYGFDKKPGVFVEAGTENK